MPILPTCLIESLDMPQPYLAGITSTNFRDFLERELDFEEVAKRTWVLLDSGCCLEGGDVEVDEFGTQILWAPADTKWYEWSSQCER